MIQYQYWRSNCSCHLGTEWIKLPSNTLAPEKRQKTRYNMGLGFPFWLLSFFSFQFSSLYCRAVWSLRTGLIKNYYSHFVRNDDLSQVLWFLDAHIVFLAPTWSSRDVHLLEILALKYSNSQLSRGWHVAKREAYITQVLANNISSNNNLISSALPDRPLWLIECPSTPQWSGRGPPCRVGPSPRRSGRAWRICRNQRWQKRVSCQRFHCMEAEVNIL